MTAVTGERALGGFEVVDLSPHLDNRGITAAGRLHEGEFNIWGNSFPAGGVPPRGTMLEVGGVPFRFPAAGAGGCDNLRCAGQLLRLPVGRRDWVYLLAAAERRSEDFVYLHYRDRHVDPEWLRVADFWPQTSSRFAGLPAVRCDRMHYPRHVQHGMDPTIWRTRVPVPREEDLVALRLPDNPAIHVFALTLAGQATGSSR